MDYELDIKNLEISIKELKILRGIDLNVLPGELLVIMGPSGCGKTTLLRCIAGFEKPTNGVITIRENKVNDKNIWISPDKREIGMIFQDLALWPHLTALKHLHLVAPDDKEFNLSILEKLHLTEKSKCFPFQLSGGEQQRLAIARALAIKPRILLMDEPFSNLDWQLKEEIIALIKNIQKDLGITVIYVTHDQFEACKIGERIALMNKGKIIQVGTLDELLENPSNEYSAMLLNISKNNKSNAIKK